MSRHETGAKVDFDKWNSRYGAHDLFYGSAANDYLVAKLNQLTDAQANSPSPRSALTLGEGEGRNALELLRQNFQVTAIDGSKVAGEKAVAWAAREGFQLDYKVGDVLSAALLPPRQFDLVVNIWLHMPSATRLKMWQRMREWVKPGGHVIVEHYRPEQLNYRTGGPPDVDLLTTEVELREAFGDFEVIELKSVLRDVQEGTGHRGRSATVQLFARRPL
ncbi:MAG TPA: class I SAM-dependent methyltransferase [Pseudobdellovibrionaceae bacterium]|nr:class I SAM-dependent methyltransferase [Pseudobdellovibrionaceae bacterium]